MSDDKKAIDDTMKTPMIFSAGLHIVIFLLVIFGLPHFKKDPEIQESIPVDMVADISELTTATKPPVKAPDTKKDEPPPPKKEEPPKPLPPKQVTPPDEQELKEPPKDEPKEKDELAIPKKEEKKPEKKVEPKKPSPPKPKDEKKKPDDSQDFNKLLQNLAEDEPPQPETPPDNNKKLMTEPAPSPNVSRFSDSLSISEQDALRQQLAGCWNINPGLMNAQDLAVEIKIVVNADRTVANAQIVDQSRYNSDSFFHTMADSAIRAVQNPRCSPLRLPEDKYNLWHNMTIVFDPKEMF